MTIRSAAIAVAVALAAAIVLLPVRPALASWTHNGMPLSPAEVSTGTGLVSDGAGGIFVFWADDSIHMEMRAQRLQSDGSVAPGWPEGGAKVANVPVSDGAAVVDGIDAALQDGFGGAYVLYRPRISHATRTSLGRISASGSIPSGWPVDNITSGRTTIAADDAGDVFYAFPITNFLGGTPGPYWFQRRRADGSPGAVYETLQANNGDMPAIDTDHSGGAFAGCLCGVTGLDSAMTEHWSSGPWPGCTSDLTLISDGGHGAFVAWIAGSSVKACRIDPAGEVVAGWNPNGVVVGIADAATQAGLQLERDGTGGLFVLSNTQNGHIVQRVTGTGTVAAGWMAAGSPIGDPSGAKLSRLVPDGAGGLYVGWSQGGVFAQHLTAVGVPAPGWLSTGDPISVDGAFKLNVAAATDGAGGVYFAWTDARTSPPSIYGQHLSEGDMVPLSVPPTRAVELSITPRANPSRDGIACAFTLPTGGAARIEAFDTAGRRVAGRSIEGAAAGPNAATLCIEGANPGVYLVRLTQGARSALTRVVVVR